MNRNSKISQKVILDNNKMVFAENTTIAPKGNLSVMVSYLIVPH